MMNPSDYLEELYELEFTVVRDLEGRALYILYDVMVDDDDEDEEEIESFRWRTSQSEEWHETDNEDDMTIIIEAFNDGTLWLRGGE